MILIQNINISGKTYLLRYQQNIKISRQFQNYNMNWDCSLILRSSLEQQTQSYQSVSARLRHKNSSQLLPNVHNKSINIRKEGQDKTKQEVKKKMSLKSKNNSKNKTSENLKTQESSCQNRCQNYSPAFCSGNQQETVPRFSTEPFFLKSQKNISFKNLRENENGFGHRRCDTVTFRTVNSTNISNMSSNASHAQYNKIQPQQRVAAFCPTARVLSPQFQNKIITILPTQISKTNPLIKINHCIPEYRNQSKISFKSFSNLHAGKSEKKEGAMKSDKKCHPSEKQNTQNTQNSVFPVGIEKSQKESIYKNSKISTKLSCQNNTQSIIETKYEDNSEISFNADESIKHFGVPRKRKIEDFLKYQNEIRSVRDSDQLSEEYSQVVITFKDLVENERQQYQSQ